MTTHHDELRDQHNAYHDSLDDLTDTRGAALLVAYILIAAFIVIVCTSLLVWAYWPSQIPVLCQAHIGGEVVACAEGL